jgi:hypothetical protein
MGKAEERRLAGTARGHAAWLQEQEGTEGMTQVPVRAHANDEDAEQISLCRHRTWELLQAALCRAAKDCEKSLPQ